jgi:hypothetical protein
VGLAVAEQARRLVAAADSVLSEPSADPLFPANRALWVLSRRAEISRGLVRLDRAVRRVDAASFPAWSGLRPDNLATGELDSTPLPDVLAMHPNGRVRAAVVDTFASEPNRHLAALALRCVDPAMAVRERAVAIVVPAVDASPVHELIGLEPVLLGEQMRRLAPEVVDATERALLADPRTTLEHVEWDAHRTARLLGSCPAVRTADLLGCWIRRGPAPLCLFDLGVERASTSDVTWFLRDEWTRLPAHHLVWLCA